MGMAASQARLLCITARIHDIEFQAQSIQTAKLQLATQSDRAYNEYLDALDATTLTISAINPNSGEKSTLVMKDLVFINYRSCYIISQRHKYRYRNTNAYQHQNTFYGFLHALTPPNTLCDVHFSI